MRFQEATLVGRRKARDRAVLHECESRRIVAAAGIPVSAHGFATTAAEDDDGAVP